MVRAVTRVVVIAAMCGLLGGWPGAGLRAASPWETAGVPHEISDIPSIVVSEEPPPVEGAVPQSEFPSEGPSEDLPEAMPGDGTFIVVPDGLPGERADPTFAERLGGLMPEFPGGPALNRRLAEHLRCFRDGCWVVRTEAIAVWRNAPSNRPLFTSIVDDGFGGQALGPVVLDANQLRSDPLTAGRLTLGRLDECGRGIETSYLYAGTFYSARTLPYVQNGYALAEPGIYGNPWGIPAQGSGPDATPISAAQTQLTGTLQSLEVNWREPIGWGATRLLVGFRWLQWQETWLMADQFTDPNDPTITGADSYSTACMNDLYGGQIGLDTVLWNPGKGLRLESVVKAGAYYTNASQSSAYAYETTAPFAYAQAITVAGNPAGCSFVGELGLTAVVPLRKHLDLRCSYFGLWLDSIAQPTNQLAVQNLSQKGPGEPATGRLLTNGLLVLQGVSLGLEGRW